MIRLYKIPYFWWILLTVWLLVLWYLSSQSTVLGPKLFLNFDKVEHGGYFYGGAVILYIATRLTWPDCSHFILCLTTVFVLSTYGIIDEWHQSFTPGRSGLDFGDWTADTLGALIGALTTPFWIKWLKIAQKPDQVL